MRRLLLALSLVAAPALAGERYLGTVALSTTSATNATTGTPFTIPASAKISIQCDAAAFITVCGSSACVAATTTSVKVTADQLFQTSTPGASSGAGYVAGIVSTGTTSCRVFERAGSER